MSARVQWVERGRAKIGEATSAAQRWGTSLGMSIKGLGRYPGFRGLGDLVASFTELAWGLSLVGGILLAIGLRMGWPEFAIPGAGALSVVLVAVLMSFRRYQAVVDLSVSQERVSVGEVVTGQITLTARRHQVIQPLQILLPIGENRVSLWSPRLKPTQSFNEPFLLSTSRRGRITVGPAQAVRADGLGVVRRVQHESDAVEVYVHPRTVPIASQVLGFIKDLEGVVTQDLSSSDVSFRALRDYVPGDDRRSIHWKTTARVDKLMVRQFEETRRAHLLLVIDCAHDAWGSPNEFEHGVSVAASLVRAAAAQAIRTDLYLSTGLVRAAQPMRMLDELSVVERTESAMSPRELMLRAVSAAPHASVTMFISGSENGSEQLTGALSAVSQDMKFVGIRMNQGSESGIHTVGDGLILELPRVDHLPRALNRVFA